MCCPVRQVPQSRTRKVGDIMPFKSAYEGCWHCGAELIVVCTRDITRKKFCSYACRQKWRYEQGEWDMKKVSKSAHTPEANAKKGRKGSANGRWIPDRKLVKRPITSYEGTQWRKAVYERDNYTCQICGERGGKLNAHHIKTYATHPELRFDLDNGITLCVQCHKSVHPNGWHSVVPLPERETATMDVEEQTKARPEMVQEIWIKTEEEIKETTKEEVDMDR